MAVATNSSIHPQPRLKSQRIHQVLKQYGYIVVEGSTIVIQSIPARATLWRKHRQLLLHVSGEQFLFRRGRKLSRHEPLEWILEHLSTLDLSSENYPVSLAAARHVGEQNGSRRWRYKLELESLEPCRASSITGLSHRRIECRGLNNDQPVDGHVPRSHNDAIQHATVHTRDQFPMLCTPSGSI